MPELGSEGVGGVNRLEGSVRTGRGSCQANRASVWHRGVRSLTALGICRYICKTDLWGKERKWQEVRQLPEFELLA